ncbi:hypothetical protein [Ascidiimonas aurantiaca]
MRKTVLLILTFAINLYFFSCTPPSLVEEEEKEIQAIVGEDGKTIQNNEE